LGNHSFLLPDESSMTTQWIDKSFSKVLVGGGGAGGGGIGKKNYKTSLLDSD
jgi:hypothetical protein